MVYIRGVSQRWMPDVTDATPVKVAGGRQVTGRKHEGNNRPVTMARMVLEELAGFVVGVTADRRADEQIGMLERRGPRSSTAPPSAPTRSRSTGRWPTAIEDLIAEPPGMTILSTGIGVRGVIEAAEVLGRAEALVDALAGSRVFARGPKAHGAAVTVGLPVDVEHRRPACRATSSTSSCPTRSPGCGWRCSSTAPAPSRWPTPLTALGADVVPIPVYRWSLPDDAAPAVRLAQAVADRRVDAVTFTARPQIESLCEIAETEGLLDPMRQGFAATWSWSLRRPGVRRRRGGGRVRRAGGAGASPARVDGGQRHRGAVRPVGDASASAGRRRPPAGPGVPVGGEIVQLSERERDLLAALARRPGVVLSKGELLAGVWPDGDADQHAVEVAIARLRRRLGAHGHLLETVFRRGYRLAA